MQVANNWKDYEIIDCSSGEKLERWGDYILLRPDPQVIWKTNRSSDFYKKLNAHYHRSNKGGGNFLICLSNGPSVIQYVIKILHLI